MLFSSISISKKCRFQTWYLRKKSTWYLEIRFLGTSDFVWDSLLWMLSFLVYKVYLSNFKVYALTYHSPIGI